MKMLRAQLTPTMLITALLTALTLTPAARAQTDSTPWKLYDVRDLMSVIPPPKVNMETSQRVMLESLLQPVTPDTGSTGEAPGQVEQLMDKLCDALGLQCKQFLVGVYGIEAREEEHAQILELIEQVRALYVKLYEVEIFWYPVPADQAPSPGQEAKPTDSSHRHRLVVPSRTPTPLTQVSLHTYVAGLQPVVATSSAAYDVQTRTAADGLQATVLVGVGEEDPHTTSLQITGDLRRVRMDRKSAPIMNEGATLQVDLPVVTIRSVQCSQRIGLGANTVLTVVDGFGEGQCIVIAARVEALGI
jgi:hypothetical protein